MFSRSLTRTARTATRSVGSARAISTLSPNLYTAVSTAKGSRAAGTAETADGHLKLKMGMPVEMGGSKTSTANNPEQLFGAAWATCFLSALNAVHGQNSPDLKPLPKSTTVRANVSIGKDATEKQAGFLLAVELEVLSGPLKEVGLGAEAIEKLVEDAHAMCPYSRATRGNIETVIKVVDA